MEFKAGDKVVFLSEIGGGIVREVSSNGTISVEDEDGFEHDYEYTEIAKVHTETMPIKDHFYSDKNNFDSTPAKPLSVRTGKRQKTTVWEIDLHIEEIVDAHYMMSNTEILKKQMDAFKRFYSNARKKNIQRLIAIHGIGEGVLKHEIRDFLKNVDGVEFYDADYREYGKGATAIDLRYNY